MKQKTAAQISKEILASTINPCKPLIAYVATVTKQAKRLEKTNIDNDALAVSIFTLFKKSAVNYKANTLINAEIRRQEGEQKKKMLDDTLEINLKQGKVFYIASRHGDCAKDHLQAQGRLYVDERYKQLHNDDINAYVAKHGVKTVQEITGKPTWFLTRPHCRHYMKELTIEQVLKGYKVPTSKVGNRYYRTPKQANIDYYKDRLEMLSTMYKKYPTEELKNLILKTKILIRKWQER